MLPSSIPRSIIRASTKRLPQIHIRTLTTSSLHRAQKDYTWIRDSEMRLLRSIRDSLPKPSTHILFRQKLQKLEEEGKGNEMAGPEIFRLIEKIKVLAEETERNDKMRVEQLDGVIREVDGREGSKGEGTRTVKEKVVGERRIFK